MKPYEFTLVDLRLSADQNPFTLSCAKIQHPKDDTHCCQKQVEPCLNIPENERCKCRRTWDTDLNMRLGKVGAGPAGFYPFLELVGFLRSVELQSRLRKRS